MTIDKPPYATLRKRLFWWGDRFTDRACDFPDTRWTWLNDLPFTLAEQAQRLFCALLGHLSTPDDCGIPAHDYCIWCRKTMPRFCTTCAVNGWHSVGCDAHDDSCTICGGRGVTNTGVTCPGCHNETN